MKVWLPVLFGVALPCVALAQVREDDLRIATARIAYDTCINSKVATARAMRGDHKWLQKLVEAECKTQADALHGAVAEWSKEQKPSAAAAEHETVAGFYVSKVMFNRVYGAGPAAFGGPDTSSGSAAERSDLGAPRR